MRMKDERRKKLSSDGEQMIRMVEERGEGVVEDEV